MKPFAVCSQTFTRSRSLATFLKLIRWWWWSGWEWDLCRILQLFYLIAWKPCSSHFTVIQLWNSGFGTVGKNLHCWKRPFFKKIILNIVYVHVLLNDDSTHSQEGLTRALQCFTSYTGFSPLLCFILPNFPSTPPFPFLCSTALD